MRTLPCKHKIWGKKWLYLRPYLKAFPVFNVLETCREYLLTIDLEIAEFIKKRCRAVFGKMQNLQAWTKLRPKTVTKAAECKSIKFFSLAIALSNSPLFVYAVFNGIKPLWDEAVFPKLISFLQYQRIAWIACYFTVFMIVKTACQNISKTLSQNLLKLCHNGGNCGRYILP